VQKNKSKRGEANAVLNNIKPSDESESEDSTVNSFAWAHLDKDIQIMFNNLANNLKDKWPIEILNIHFHKGLNGIWMSSVYHYTPNEEELEITPAPITEQISKEELSSKHQWKYDLSGFYYLVNSSDDTVHDKAVATFIQFNSSMDFPISNFFQQTASMLNPIVNDHAIDIIYKEDSDEWVRSMVIYMSMSKNARP
jgi:hypothetical protein